MFKQTYLTNVLTPNLRGKFLQTSEGPSFIRKCVEQFLYTITFVLSQQFNNTFIFYAESQDICQRKQ